MTTLRRLSQVIMDLRELGVIKKKDSIDQVFFSESCSLVSLTINFKDYKSDFHVQRVNTIMATIREEFTADEISEIYDHKDFKNRTRFLIISLIQK